MQNHEIHIRNKAGYKSEIKSGDHLLTSDEPLECGGTNLGLNPYDLLLSSLGSCIAITMRMYAERKNFPLEDIILKLSHQKIYAEDCVDCESKEGKIDKIDIKINLIGDLSTEQRSRLLEISVRCPVHKTLMSEIKINTSLVH